MAVTDLTGTKWRFNDTCTSAGATKGFNITYTSSYDNVERTILRSPYSFRGAVVQTILLEHGLSGFYCASTDGLYSQVSDGEGWYYSVYDPETSGYTYIKGSTPPTISITGGQDVTNSDLISWLQANATQIQEQSNTFSIGNLPIANMFFGTRQVNKIYLGNSLIWESATEPIPENALLVRDGALLTSDGGYLVTTVTLISFTIEGDTYQAEAGMDWFTWVYTAYDKGRFKTVSSRRIVTSDAAYAVALGSNRVNSDDIILANTAYSYLSND